VVDLDTTASSDDEEVQHEEAGTSEASELPPVDSPPSRTQDAEPERRETTVRRPTGPRKLVTIAFDEVEQINPGIPLSAGGARNALATEPTQMVALVGPPDSGKTTLLAVLHESFCFGPQNGWSFAGSDTLVGFLQRSWYALAVSGGGKPTTPRTRYGIERPYLHIRMSREQDRSPTSLLIADLSGEYFAEIGSGAPLGEVESIVARADHLLHIVDAASFESSLDHFRAMDAYNSRVRRLAETGAYQSSAIHSVVITRLDRCPDPSVVKAYAAELSDEWFDGCPVISTIARPESDEMPSGLGDLLATLSRKPVELSTTAALSSSYRPHVERRARAGSLYTEDGGT
jgi:hypothetical protein